MKYKYDKPKKDITGQIFGKLKVLRMEITSKSNGNEYRAICECLNCGKTDFDIRPAALKLSKTGTCGCDKSYFIRQTGINSKLWKGFGDMSGRFISNSKRRAKQLNLDFNLSAEYLWDLYEKQDRKCALSGIYICFGKNRKRSDGTASLDRKNSEKGYTEDNVQWVHKDVNLMKMYLDEKYFINMCMLITENFKK